MFNRFQGFDEHSLSAGTGSMHHAADPLALLGLDRDHEALAADSDEFVLHRAAFGQPPQVAAQ